MKTKNIAACLFAVFTASAFISSRTGAPAPHGPAIDPALNMPPHIAAFVTRSCADCHTANTRWPWYAKVPPVAWMIQRDVSSARKAMNWTEWPSKRGIAIGRLAAACSDVQSGRMPKAQYLWMHPSARPSRDEAAAFCDWTKTEIGRLASVRVR